MCTLTFLPLENGSYIITSNRDEAPMRKTLPPVRDVEQGVELIYPKDSQAGGSWICAGNNNRVACLLNGAFERHMRKPPYRKSRGLVVIEYFALTGGIRQLYNAYDLTDIEPFTLVVCEADKLFELRWDGAAKHFKTLRFDKPHIWASANLYTPEYIEKRKEWFNKWLADHPQYHRDEILNFHVTGGEGNVYNDIVMNRAGLVRTVSITSILKEPKQIDMRYHDLLSDEQTEASLLL